MGQAATTRTAVGVDIGGTGIKAGIVDLDAGVLTSDRVKVATPEGAEPADVLAAVQRVLDQLGVSDASIPLGVAFPAIVKHGRTLSAANVSKKWIDFPAEEFFESGLGREIHFANDADVAGVAELRHGAAKGQQGLTILTTLGTGIGSAMIYDGVLVPNSEMGHLELDGVLAESRAATSAREREGLSWEAWSERLTTYFRHLERLFTPDLFVVGGGVSKSWEKFGHRIEIETEIIPAKLENRAGIVGAALVAHRKAGQED